MKLNDVVVLLPTLNEEKSVGKVIQLLKEQGVNQIIVVDGNSTDKTVKIAEGFGAKIVLQEGKGKGNGFKSFLKKVPVDSNKLYVMLDADASYDPRELPKILALLNEFDVVSGSRQILAYDFRSFVHVIGGQLISLIGSILFLKWNPDITTGYWGFRGSALKKMSITANRFELEADLFAETCLKRLNFKSIPVSYEKRIGESKLTWSDAFKITLKLVQKRVFG